MMLGVRGRRGGAVRRRSSSAQGAEARDHGIWLRRMGLDMIMVRAGGEVQVFAPTADRGLTVLVEPDARAIERTFRA